MQPSTNFKKELGLGFVIKTRYIIAILFAVILFLISCNKDRPTVIQRTLAEQYFEDNILGKDFIIKLATDSSVNLTAKYTGYTFKLTKNTLLDGPMAATINGLTTTGTWACNADYSKLTISLSTTTPDFIFLNREWRFTKKTIPTLELAPWGTTEPKVLHMERL
jgi:hypothetical protein